MLDQLKRRVKDRVGMATAIIEFESQHVTRADRLAGERWYPAANDAARRIALNVFNDESRLNQIAGVISALSPAVSWELNLEDAERLAGAFNAGLTVDDVTVSTYGQNKDKAYRILNGDTSFNAVREQFTDETKTAAFLWCIAYPNGVNYVTVDRHAVGIALQSYGSDHLGLSITAKRYRDISAAYELAAERLGYVVTVAGLEYVRPMILQAATWVAYRRKFGGS